MDVRSNTGWIVGLVAAAVVIAGGAWLLTDRDQTEPLGEPVAAESDETSATEPQDAPSWLFSVTAGAGTYAENSDGTATLTLTEVDEGVTAFTDRPERDTAVIPAPKLVDAWPSLFADSPPNAVLVGRTSDGPAQSYVLELTDPTSDGTTLTFTASVVAGKDHSAQVPGMTPAPATPPPADFESVSLFVDNVLASQMWICSKSGEPAMSSPAPMPYPASTTATNTFEVQCLAAGGKASVIGAAQ